MSRSPSFKDALIKEDPKHRFSEENQVDIEIHSHDDQENHLDKSTISQPIPRRSQPESLLYSTESKALDVGLETLNMIDHMDLLNSAAPPLLNKNSNFLPLYFMKIV